jgi:hypothetical protein
MQTVTAPKAKRKIVIKSSSAKGRSMMPPPSQTHRDRKAHAKKYACRNKGRNKGLDF